MDYLKFFKTKKRGDKTITINTDDCPEYLKDFIHEAHNGMLPDDYKYQFIYDAFYLIANHDSIDDARDGIEPDIYNHNLITWLGSHTDRQAYCDDAIGEYGIDTAQASIIQIISWGQYKERSEIFELVAEFVEQQKED